MPTNVAPTTSTDQRRGLLPIIVDELRSSLPRLLPHQRAVVLVLGVLAVVSLICAVVLIVLANFETLSEWTRSVHDVALGRVFPDWDGQSQLRARLPDTRP